MANSARTAGNRVLDFFRWIAIVWAACLSLIYRPVLSLAFIAALFGIYPAHATTENYVYDELGRLVQVVAADGSSTQYAYDVVGNVTAVKADAVTTLAIASFTPTTGPVGTSVTLFGSGFSATPSSNAVTVNNVAATVTSASASRLIVTVPATATTGPIKVTNTNGTVTSTTSFTVGSSLLAPTVTGFSPAIGSAGTSVTITGTNFAAGTANNKALFGGVGGVITALSAPTQITATTSNTAISGKVSVVTAGGTGASSGDFYAVPGGVAVADVLATNRIVVDGATITPTIGTAGKYAMLIFDGTAGQELGLGMMTVTPTPSDSSTETIRLYGPNGNILTTCTISQPDKCLFSALPQTGTYSILIGMDAGHSANMSFMLSSKRGSAFNLNAATTFAITRGGQQLKYVFFNSSANSVYSLYWSGATFSDFASLIVTAPDGSIVPNGNILLNSSSTSQGTEIFVAALPGSYTLTLTPATVQSGQVVVQVQPLDGGIITVNGTPLAITPLWGAVGHYHFSGTVGQHVGFGMSGLATSPAGSATQITIMTPSGAIWYCGTFTADGSCNLPVLPSTGTYIVQEVPQSSTPVLIRANLWIALDVTGTLTPNAAPTTFSIGRAGQNGRYTFNATAGQNYSLTWTGSTFTGYGSQISILRPDGTAFKAGNIGSGYGTAGTLDLSNLDQTGTYTVFIDPEAAQIGQVSIQLLNAATGTLAVDGSALAVNQTSGMAGRYTFAGTVGQHLGLALKNFTTTPAGGSATVSVLNPDNSLLVSCGGFTADNSCNLPSLPAAGNYTVLVTPSPNTAITGSMTLSSDVQATLTANATATTFATTRPGQNARYTFTATAGQNYTLTWSGATFVGYNSVMTVYAPDGTALSSTASFSNTYPSGSTEFKNLTQSGVYTVFVDPYAASTGQIAIQLLSPASGTLTVDGSPLAINQLAGANGRYTFVGTVGQHLGLGFSSIVITPSGTAPSISILSPDNSILTSCSIGVIDSSCNLAALPATGTYTVLVSTPSSSTAVAGTLTLSSDVAATLTANAAATTFNTTRVGQNARYSFSATAGQNFSLVWSNTTFSDNYVTLNVLAPDGTKLITYTRSALNTYPSGEVELRDLPQTGTYTVFVDPYADGGQISVQLLAPATGTITTGGASLAINQVAGASGRYTFSGTTGQNLGLGISSLHVTPSGDTVNISVLAPNGATLFNCYNGSADSACSIPTLTATGIYTLLVVPSTSASATTATLTLSNDVTGVLTPNAAVTTFTTSRAGQNARYTFTATSGDNPNLAWTGTTFGGNGAVLTVKAPDGTTLPNGTGVAGSSQPTGELQLSNLQQTGTYTLLVRATVGSGQIGLQLLTPASGTVTINVGSLAINQSAGAIGRYTFSGTVGQQLGLGISSLVTSPIGQYATFAILTPSGTLLSNCASLTQDGSCNVPTLPATGTYTILVTPPSSTVGVSANLTLSTDITGSLSIGGLPATFSTGRAGQNGRYTFSATAGQNLSLSFTGSTFANGGSILSIKAPDNTSINSIGFGGVATSSLAMTNLPQSGTYTVFLDPYQNDIGHLSFSIVQTGTTAPASGPSNGTLVIDGSALSISQTGAVENYTFSGTIGQTLSLGVSNLVTSAGYVPITVTTPTGSTLTSCNASAGNTDCKFTALPESGTYSVQVSASDLSSPISATLTLSNEVSGSLVLNAAPVTVAVTRFGQNIRYYTFSGTAGQTLGLTWTGATFAGVYSNILNVQDPDGVAVGSGGYPDATTFPTGSIDLGTLTKTGTYRIELDPYQSATGQLNLQVVQSPASALAINGTPTVFSQANGLTGRYTFAGTAGQLLSLGITNLAVSSGYANVFVIAPNGSALSPTCGGYTTDGNCSLAALPATGTYTVTVAPSASYGSGASISGTLTLSTDVNGALTANAAPTLVSLTRAGQSARYYTFNATAGQSFSLAWTNASLGTASGSLAIMKPDGVLLDTKYVANGSYQNGWWDLSNLPQTGSYIVSLMLSAPVTGQVDLQLLSAASSALIVDGAPLAITQSAGAEGRYTFNGTVGQRLGLGLTNLVTTPAGLSATMSILTPVGATLSVSCDVYGCPLPVLSAAGAYTVVVTPPNATTSVNATLTLSTDVSGTLTPNAAPVAVNVTRAGQNIRSYTFNGTAGQNFTLVWSGATFTGSSNFIYVQAPDGTSGLYQTYLGASRSTGSIDLSNLPQTGTYQVVVQPYTDVTGQVSLQLLQPAAGALTVGGPSLSINQVAGQNGRYTFSGTAGQLLSLGVTNFVSSPNSYANVTLITPSGLLQSLCNGALYAGNTTCSMPALPATGTYTVLITPYDATNTVQATLILSADQSGVLTANAAATAVTLSRAGQGVRYYTFSATSGQDFSLALTGGSLGTGSANVQVTAPDGTVPYQGRIDSASYASNLIDMTNIAQTGTYRVSVMTTTADTGQFNLQLLQATTGSLTINGAALAINQAAGASGQYTFSGTAGQQVSLGVTNLTTTPAGGNITVSVMSPNGATQLTTCAGLNIDTKCPLGTLAATGTYILVVTPGSAKTAVQANLVLSSDQTGTLIANAAATTVSISRVGQNAHYTFSGIAGQRYTIAVTGATFPGPSGVYIGLRTPDGVDIYDAIYNLSVTSGQIVLPVLPQTGTYTVTVTPNATITGQVTIQLLAPATATATVDGGSIAINQAAGQLGFYTFAATAGQFVKINLPTFSSTPTGAAVTVTVYGIDGVTALNSIIATGIGPSLLTMNAPDISLNTNKNGLPSTGTYTIGINTGLPNVPITGTLSVQSFSLTP